jgi:hypothetical protein
MMTTLRSVIALLLLTVPLRLGADDAAPPDLAALRAHLAFLADDRLEGRDTASRGHELAALYAATRLAEYGLRPGNGEAWEQRIPFASARRIRSSITLEGAGSARRLEWKRDYLCRRTRRMDRRTTAVSSWADVRRWVGRDDYAGMTCAFDNADARRAPRELPIVAGASRLRAPSSSAAARRARRLRSAAGDGRRVLDSPPAADRPTLR